jgi:heme-degrading monooxygenase HmoA
MVTEVAQIKVLPGHEERFADAYRGARHVLAGTPGCHSVRMTRGIETPTLFVLIVEWVSVEAHEQNFRGTDRFVQWRAAIGPHFDGPPNVEHFADV